MSSPLTNRTSLIQGFHLLLDQGFCKSFADGVERIQFEHGLMKVRLKE